MGVRNIIPLISKSRCGTIITQREMEIAVSVSDARKETMARYNEQNKARILFQSAEYRDKLRLEMVEAYGGCCQECGEDDPIVLVLDHINDDPEPEYAQCGASSRGGYWLYRKLRAEGWPTERFQLLCSNCNMRKEYARRRTEMQARYGASPEIGETPSRTEARAKAGPNSNNTSGFKGVLWDNSRKKWLARTRYEGKIKFFGRFENIADAAKAYKEGAIKLHGSFAYVPTDSEIEEIAAKQTRETAPRVRRVRNSLRILDAKSPEDLGL